MWILSLVFLTRFYRPRADIAGKEKSKQVTFSQPEVNIEDKVDQLEKMITQKFGKEQDMMKSSFERSSQVRTGLVRSRQVKSNEVRTCQVKLGKV